MKECSTIDNHKTTSSSQSIIQSISNDRKLKNEQTHGNTLRSAHAQDYREFQEEKGELAPLASLESLSLSSNNSILSRTALASSPKLFVACSKDNRHEQDSNCLTSSLSRSPVNVSMFKFRSLSDHSNLNSAITHNGTSPSALYSGSYNNNYTETRSSRIPSPTNYNGSSYNLGIPKSVLLSNPSSTSAISPGNNCKRALQYTPSLSTIYPQSVFKKSSHVNSSVDPILEHIRNERKISRESSV